MLYSSNTFALTKNHIKVNHDVNGQFIGRAIRDWLNSTGENKFMVRNLVIDLDAICHERCEKASDYNKVDGQGLLNFTPLLRIFWDTKLQLDITFLHPQSDAHKFWSNSAERTIYTHPVPSWDGYTFKAAALTRLLHGLLKDEVGLKRYKRIIRDVYIHRDGSGGVVQFRTSPDADWYRRWTGAPHIAYLATDDGHSLRVVSHKRPTGFQQLPEHLKDRICALSVTYKHGHIVNIDTPAGWRNISGLLCSSKDMFNQYGPCLWMINDFSLEVTTVTPHSSFQNFERLGSRLRSKINASSVTRYVPDRVTRYVPERKFGIEADFQIVLKFKLREPTTLKDVRISIMPFIFATFTTESSRNLVVVVESPSSRSSHTISLYDLRCRLMKVLSPKYLSRTSPCPDILVNGLGEVVKVLPASTATYKTWLNMHALYATPEDQWVDEDWRYLASEPPFPFDGTVGSVYDYIWGVTHYIQDSERW